MPTSFPEQIGPIIAEVIRLRPASVLDVGIGWGKYGALIREYVDEWRGGIVIDGVEPWAENRTPAWNAYDYVFDAPWPDVWRDLNAPYDVGLLVDVLEHFPPSLGGGALDRLLRICKTVIVATPREPAEQGAVGGNDLERHLSKWDELDLARIGRVVRFVPIPGDVSLVATMIPAAD